MIEPAIAVQTHIDEVRRHVARHRPLARRFRDDQCDIVRAQHRDEALVEEALVTDFHRMAQRSRLIDREVTAAVHAPVLKILELSGFTSILKVFGDVDAAVASYCA